MFDKIVGGSGREPSAISPNFSLKYIDCFVEEIRGQIYLNRWRITVLNAWATDNHVPGLSTVTAKPGPKTSYQNFETLEALCYVLDCSFNVANLGRLW
jgi:hypothetical protein